MKRYYAQMLIAFVVIFIRFLRLECQQKTDKMLDLSSKFIVRPIFKAALNNHILAAYKALHSCILETIPG